MHRHYPPPPRQHLHKKQIPIEPTLSMTQPIHDFHVDRRGTPTSIYNLYNISKNGDVCHLY